MDEDDYNTAGAAEEDLSLPKATVTKLIQEMLPEDIICAKEARDMIAECCVEFVQVISSQANEACERENKKTIGGEHIIQALQELGFEEYIQEVQEVFDDHTRSAKDRTKTSKKLEDSGKSMEELEAEQELLFAKARARLQSQDMTPDQQ